MKRHGALEAAVAPPASGCAVGPLSVIGLRITLLDGSGEVIDLAEASLRIRPLP